MIVVTIAVAVSVRADPRAATAAVVSAIASSSPQAPEVLRAVPISVLQLLQQLRLPKRKERQNNVIT